jgi:hypothetical protein
MILTHLVTPGHTYTGIILRQDSCLSQANVPLNIYTELKISNENLEITDLR